MGGNPVSCVPLFSGNCPAFVVAPASIDFQIAWRKSLKAKSEALDKRPRQCVSGLDVGFQPMESLIVKCFEKNGAKTARHISAAVMRYERIGAKIAGTEVTSYDLADRDDAGQFTFFGNYPISKTGFSQDSLQIGIEFRRSLRCRRPPSVEFPASSNSIQKFFPPSEGRLLERMGDVPAALIFQFCFSELHIGHQTISDDRYPAEHQTFRR